MKDKHTLIPIKLSRRARDFWRQVLIMFLILAGIAAFLLFIGGMEVTICHDFHPSMSILDCVAGKGNMK